MTTPELSLSPSPGGEPRMSERLLATLRRFSRLLAFLLALLILFVAFRSILLPFVFATLVAYTLSPLIRRFGPRVGGRGIAVALVYLGLGGLLAGFFGVVVPAVIGELAKLRDSTPAALTTLEDEWLPQLGAWIDDVTGGALEPAPEPEPEPSTLVVHPQPDGSFVVDLSQAHLEIHESSGGGWVIVAEPREPSPRSADVLRDLVTLEADELSEAVSAVFRTVVTGIAAFLGDVIITLLLAAYILVDLDRISSFLRSLIPVEHRGDFEELIDGLDLGLAGVVRGQLLICLLNGALTYVGLLVFGVNHAVLLALMAALLSLVPIFGSLLSALPIMAVALLSSDIASDLAFGKSLAILGWLIGIHLLEANWLNPKIIGTTARIHPIIVVFALLAGYSAYGPAGALLSIPFVSVVQAIVLHARHHSEAFIAARSDVLAIPHDLRELEHVHSRPLDLDRGGDD